MKLIVFILLVNSIAWGSCNDNYSNIEKYIPSHIKSVEEIYASSNWGVLYRKAPTKKDFLDWGKQIYEKSPKLKEPNIQEAQGALDYAEVIPEDAYFIELGKTGFESKLAKIQENRKNYLTELITEVEQNQSQIIQSSIDETVNFLKNKVGLQLANIIENIPAELKDSYQGLELGLQKFYRGMDKYQASGKVIPAKMKELLSSPGQRKPQLAALPDIANTPELQELKQLWSSIQNKAYKQQESLLSPTFDLLNTLKSHIDMTKPASNDPIVLLNENILASLSKHLDIEVMALDKGTPFNLDLHEALSVLPGSGLADNQIIHVAELGFTRRGRDIPLRYAKVVVSKN